MGRCCCKICHGNEGGNVDPKEGLLCAGFFFFFFYQRLRPWRGYVLVMEGEESTPLDLLLGLVLAVII